MRLRQQARVLVLVPVSPARGRSDPGRRLLDHLQQARRRVRHRGRRLGDGVALNDQSFGCEGTFLMRASAASARHRSTTPSRAVSSSSATPALEEPPQGQPAPLGRCLGEQDQPDHRREDVDDDRAAAASGSRVRWRAASRPSGAAPSTTVDQTNEHERKRDAQEQMARRRSATAAISITAAVAPATAGATTITLSGRLDAARREVGEQVRRRYVVQFKLLQGGSMSGSARSARPGHPRHVLARSGSRVIRAGWCSTRSRRRDLRRHQPLTTSSRTSAASRWQCSVAPFGDGVPSTARA